ncbi:hypothetical protein GCM10009555_017700 [Acrocarpospora macrocephala]|uniref:Anti-proliferative protein domain-containing protein n=1 Tax=Acrocarpospora macrocephala TaxID=150177 RepID=A0A5M3WGL2_9ACTN|nr:hypothetical protein [Acrocarpospora macrocephala]GES07430.1 hypothetical protein Amac_010250 [Acrocarpospora macrocephala]
MNASDGTAEARTAARWWADRLIEEADPDTGEDATDAAIWTARKLAQRPTLEQAEAFRQALEEAILDGPVSHPSWQTAIERDDPKWGSGLRDIGTDWGPDETLGNALEAAGLDGRSLGLLPAKTVMWISPGEVGVALGYGGQVQRLDVS